MSGIFSVSQVSQCNSFVDINANPSDAFRNAMNALLSAYPNAIVLDVSYLFNAATSEYHCIISCYANDPTLNPSSLRVYSSTVKR